MKVIEEAKNSTEIYDFRLPAKVDRTDDESDFLTQLAETRAFRRLSDVRFLGALDYYLVTSPNQYPQNSRYTRAQHSWGVAMLAQRYLREKSLSQRDRLICLGAAMLHDIGHSAFSHTIEPAFTEFFGIDHHRVSEGIIRGEDPEFEDIRATLSNFGLDPEEIIAVLNGDDKKFDSYFSGPINFDTIEGILRSRSYIKMDTLGLSPWRVLNASYFRNEYSDQNTVDQFWGLKGEIYGLVIRSALGSYLDQLFLEIFKSQKDSISPNDFYLTESQMFKKFPILRRAFDPEFIEKFTSERFEKELAVTIRMFDVDESKDFFARCDKQRYRHRKALKRYAIPTFGG
ncbi:HD domain-containing protein [Erythrobacter sp. GH1-10]|uniref:HD domain-containing protein n=1 Tax=Erythrobacter sp. GH1-10 TaxID=3349334 RepID=UPI00387826F2